MENQEIVRELRELNKKIDLVLITTKHQNSEKEYLTPKEVSDALQISRSSFDRYFRAGKIPAKKIGGKLKIHSSFVNDVLNNGLQLD
ncbi:MAG: helix-turn-helix domain-containing protein [Bacteroidetes bacterium]|nr:helix-turn-helix domain-containing protein [Bacteroidota bacterium]